MQVSYIDDVHEFDKLKSGWDSVYASDPHTTIFVSWAWLRGRFETIPGDYGDWFVLAARPDSTSPYVAFLALTIDGGRRRLQMAGSPLADHTGFVCLPDYEEGAIEAFADFMQQRLEWDRFRMRDVLDPRLELFLKCFSRRSFNVQKRDGVCCPYIRLPDTWEQYLQDFLSSKTRRNLRRYMKKVEGLDEFRVTRVQAGNLERQIETLLTLWQSRWGPEPEHSLNRFRAIMHRCFKDNCLWLTTLWEGTMPIAAAAVFADRQKSTLSGFLSGWNDEFATLSPGRVIVGYSIRYAIENRFQVYDLLRGAERYKFSFGAIERFNTDVTITRKSLRSTMKKLIRRLRSS
jgi:CelD/BcsL family acetyltransferase involved in cellulose biosynthesis